MSSTSPTPEDSKSTNANEPIDPETSFTLTTTGIRLLMKELARASQNAEQGEDSSGSTKSSGFSDGENAG